MVIKRFCSFVFCISMFYSSVYGQKFVVYGDTRNQSAVSIHTAVVTQLANENPDIIIHVGDMANVFSEVPRDFLPVINDNSITKALWDANKFLVCWGGTSHDGSESDMTGINPPMVRDNSVKYSFSSDDGKVFFVVGGYKLEGDLDWLESTLQSAAATSAKWRVLVTHALIWNNPSRSGRVVANQSDVKALCDAYHVELSFCGHDHYYQRSQLMQNDVILQNGNSFTGSVGTVANVVGDGGTDAKYDPGTAADFVNMQDNSFYGYSVVSYTDNSITVTHKNSSGSVVDEYTWTRDVVAATPLPSKKNASSAPAIRIISQTSAFVTVGFILPEALGEIRIDIDDILGRNVRTFTFHDIRKGSNEVVLDLSDSNGNELRSGLYLCRLRNRSKAASIMFVK